MEEQSQKDIAVQQAIAQFRSEMETVTVVAAADKVAYTMNWAQSDNNGQNIDTIMPPDTKVKPPV